MWGEALTAFPAVGTELDDFVPYVTSEPGPTPTLETPILTARQFGSVWHVWLPSGTDAATDEVPFVIEVEQYDYLEGWDRRLPERPATLTLIAKPYEFRRAPWDGHRIYLEVIQASVTYLRYLSPWKREVRNEQTERVYTEVLIPRYRTFPPDDRRTVFATKPGADVTGIADVAWLDSNNAGRQWAILPQVPS
jgi:hypothetical protein